AGDGIAQRFASYNRSLRERRSLRDRSAADVNHERMQLEPGSERWAAHRALSNLDANMEVRQRARMSGNVVSLAVLDDEIGFLERYCKYLESVTMRAEQAEQLQHAGTSDVDTQDLDPSEK